MLRFVSKKRTLPRISCQCQLSIYFTGRTAALTAGFQGSNLPTVTNLTNAAGAFVLELPEKLTEPSVGH